MEKQANERRKELRVPILSEKIEYVHHGQILKAKITDITTKGVFINLKCRPIRLKVIEE